MYPTEQFNLLSLTFNVKEDGQISVENSLQCIVVYSVLLF